MGFFQNIRNALIRFMYGRNGMDYFNRALFVVYIVLWLVSGLILPLLKLEKLAGILNIAMYILMFYIFFRMFSKNLYKRREENQKWINWWWKMKNRSAGAKARHADKDHKYFTCKNCKAICRVPVGKGKVIITCPKCGAQMEGKT